MILYDNAACVHATEGTRWNRGFSEVWASLRLRRRRAANGIVLLETQISACLFLRTPWRMSTLHRLPESKTKDTQLLNLPLPVSLKLRRDPGYKPEDEYFRQYPERFCYHPADELRALANASTSIVG